MFKFLSLKAVPYVLINIIILNKNVIYIVSKMYAKF